MNSWVGSREGGDGASSSSSHAHPAIPAAAKKIVQNLREIVKKHSDDEIYATLKDCDMDPNHAVHVLMNQDAFHEVKRKRIKRQEIGFKNDTRELKSKAFRGASTLDHRGKRVNYIPRHVIEDARGGDNQRIKSSQEDTSPAHGSVRTASFKSSNQTRNAGMSRRPSITPAAVQTSGEGTKVSAAPNLQSNIHTDTSVGYGVAKRQEKPAMGFDRADRKWEGRRFNTGVADESVLRSAKLFSTSRFRKVFPAVRNSVRSSHDNHSQDGGVYETLPEKQKRAFGGQLVSRPNLQSYQRNRVSYQTHHVPNLQRKALEWKPKAIVATADEYSEAAQTEKSGSSPLVTDLPVSIEVQTELISKLEGLNLLDDPPVIIPEHLRVPEEDCAGLNFGSFDTDFELSFNTGPNDSEYLPGGDTCLSPEVCPVQQLNSSVTEMPSVETGTPSHPQSLSPTSLETHTPCSDAVLSMLPVGGKATEIAKSEIATHQGTQFSFIPSASNDQNSVLGGPQSLYRYDVAETQLPETSRPNFAPFADPSPNYVSPVFRPTDVETRYQFLSLPGASKFGANISSVNVQTITSSQEHSQNAGMPHTTLAVGQPSIPVHAYAGAQPAGVTIPPYPTNMYGYQYVPSNYAYMHAPYQTSYPPANSGYLQPPIGSSFTPSGRVYPSAGSNTVKFPPAQYKLGTGSTPHAMVAAGYGSYQTAPSGFAGINSSVTTGSATSYDGDMIAPQYKENALYNASQQVRVHNLSLGQVEASPLWVHSRDVSGMQANSFYNVHGPGQHAGYMPSQPAHAHHAAGFASYSQSAPGPNNHQLIQQPQALGSVGAAGSHAVMFSQPQRGPVNWTSNYSNLIRGQ